MAVAATIAVDLIARTEAFSSAMKETTTKLQEVGTQMKDIGKTMSTYVTAPIVGGFALATMAADKQAAAEARLEAVIRATGGAAGVSADHVKALASQLQRTTTFGDEATIAAASLLLTFKGVSNGIGESNQVFDRAIIVGQDMAALIGTDLNNAMMMLGKALEDPRVGITALRRAGLTFTDSQRTMIDTLVKSGQSMEAQKMILDALESQVAGTARAVAATAGGTMRQAFNDVGDAMERVGQVFDPIRIRLSQGVSDMARRFQELPSGVVVATVAIAGLAAAIGPLLVVTGTLLTSYAKVIQTLPVLMNNYNAVANIVNTKVVPSIVKMNAALVANPIGIVVVALGALAAAFVYVYQRSETFRELVSFMVQPILNLATAIRDGLGQVLIWLGNAFSGVFSSITETVSGFVTNTLNFLGNLLPEGVRNSMEVFSENMTSRVRKAVDTTKQILSELRAPSLDAGISGSNAAAVNALYGPIIEASNEAADAVSKAAKAYNDALLEGARLGTLNNSEIAELLEKQKALRLELQSGNLTLARRNELTREANAVTEALNVAHRVQIGEIAASSIRVGVMTSELTRMSETLGRVDQKQKEAISSSDMFALRLRNAAESAKETMKDLGGSAISAVAALNPMGAMAKIVGYVLKDLAPFVEALQRPMQLLGEIVAKALMPILEALFPVFKFVAIIATYLGQALFSVAGGIQTVVGGVIKAIGTLLSKIPGLGGFGRGIAGAGESMMNIGAGFRDAARGLSDARQEIRNLEWGGGDEVSRALSQGNKEQTKTAINTQRIADAMEAQTDRPSVVLNIQVRGEGDPDAIGRSVAAQVMEEIDRALGETTLRETRLDGTMVAL